MAVVTYSTPGSFTFTAPIGITGGTVDVLAEGAGGGGGSELAAVLGGGGGGGGGTGTSNGYAVTAGVGYSVVVGAGGAGSTGGADGANGGPSSFDTTGAVGDFGRAGTGGGTSGVGGNGGTTNTGSTATSSGSNGANANVLDSGDGGASGAGNPGGLGGTAGNNGAQGTPPGSGGGGGAIAAAGRDGKVTVSYTLDTPAPTYVTPSGGTTAGATAVTIKGSGFSTGCTVTFGGVAATSVAVVDGSTITCNTPAHAQGVVNVVVTNADSASGTITNGFTYFDANGTPYGQKAIRYIDEVRVPSGTRPNLYTWLAPILALPWLPTLKRRAFTAAMIRAGPQPLEATDWHKSIAPIVPRRRKSPRLINRVADAERRLAAFVEKTTNILNSLLVQGYIVEDPLGTFKILGGVLSMDRAPTGNDDELTGVVTGAPWLDTSTTPPSLYFCLDATAYHAIWRGPV